jgi:diguanylate cyclase (GGDEF)-like protein
MDKMLWKNGARLKRVPRFWRFNMISTPQRPTFSLPPVVGDQKRQASPPAAQPRLSRVICRLGEDGGAWLATIAAYALLSLLAGLTEHYGQVYFHPLQLFFLGLALLTALLPAIGPRGQRIALLSGVGLAAALLLPPFTATLPVLLANALYAVSRDTQAARRGVLGRGLWLALATFAASFCVRLIQSRGDSVSLGVEFLVTFLYTAVYVAGRQVGLRRYPAQRAGWKRSWTGGRLETAGLLACIPVAVLMTITYPKFGIFGVVATAGLMALLLVIAAFGFEASLLREQVKAMEKISAITLSQTNPAKVIERFLQLSTGLVPSDRASLWLTDNSETRLERVARRQSVAALTAQNRINDAGDETASLRFGEGLVGRVAARQAPLSVRDGARDPRFAPPEDARVEPHALLLLPLVAGGETVGVVQFERDAPGHYTHRDMSRVRSLASQVAATIANMRMHRDIYNQAVTDGLTGLYNRRHVQTALIEERHRAVRYGHPLSVIMLDVDGFKSYNDTYGHPQGDLLLKMLADLLRENLRAVDTVGRYGGEEFIILMPETTKEEAAYTAERLRRSVADAVFPGFADDPGMVVFKTISLGVSTFPHDTDDAQTLVSLADQALYRAKRGGRNQVVVTTPASVSVA